MSRRQDEHPGKVSYYFDQSSSEDEHHQRPSSGATAPCAWRTSTEIKEPLMLIEERERETAERRERERENKWKDKRNLDFVCESIDFFALGWPCAHSLLLV